MNLSIQTNLCKDNIENFSLQKDKKIKLFGFYKDTKYKNINKMKTNNSLTISRNDIYISKEINLHFLKSNTNNSNENKNNSLKQDILNTVMSYDTSVDMNAEQVPFIIYNSEVTEKNPYVYTDYATYVNILPTLANLFAIDYESRLY